MSFTLEMAMAPRFGLRCRRPWSRSARCWSCRMPRWSRCRGRAVRERGAGALDAGDCPICRGRGAPVPGVLGASAAAPGSRLADAADRAAAEPDTHALLRAVRMETAAADAPIVEYLVDSLDEHGLLDRSCAQIAAELGSPRRPWRACSDVIRRCGPPGVGAPSCRECLLLQLDALGLDDDRARLARAVIADHLPALARGHFTSIAHGARRVARRGPAGARPDPAAGCGRIRRSTATRRRSSYVVPDVVVREHDVIAGAFAVELVEPALTRLAVRRGGARGGLGPAGARRSSPSCTIAGTPCGESPSTRSSASGTSWSAGDRAEAADPRRGRRRARPARVHGQPGGRRQVRAPPRPRRSSRCRGSSASAAGSTGSCAGCWSRPTARCPTSASPTGCARPAIRSPAGPSPSIARASDSPRRRCAEPTPAWPASC